MPARGLLVLVATLLLSGCSLLFSSPDGGACTPPAIVGTVSTEASAVVAVDDYAYVGGWAEGIEVLRISDPTSPASCGWVGFVEMEADVVDSFAVVGDAIYFTKRDYGLWKLTFAGNPCDPVEEQVAFGPRLFDVIQCEGSLCAATENVTVDIYSDAGVLEDSIPLGTYDDVVRLAMAGDHILAATDWGDDLVAVSFSTREPSPTTVGERVADVAVSGNVIVVAAGSEGIVALDGGQLPRIHDLGGALTSGSDAFAVAFDGRWAFVCSDDDEAETYWLDVFDLADPANPLLTYPIQLEDECIDLDLTPDRVLVAADSKLHVVDRGCAR